jgi:hypothetical protein
VTDELRRLPPFRWRGIAYPVLARNVSFSHDGAPTRIQYRDGEFIEQLGARSPTFSYTLALREDIAIKDYLNLFTEGLPILFRDMLDKTRAILEDPVYGSFSCVPQSFDDDIDLQKRDGTDVRVIFTRSVDIASPFAEEPNPTISGLITDAGKLDEDLARVDWGQEASPEPSMDALNAIAGFGAQIEGNANKGVAALEATAFKLEKIEEQAARLENPDGFQIQRAARRNRAAATNLASRARDPQRQVVTVTARYLKTISGVAAEAGMTVKELLDLNPSLARRPSVPPNTPIRVYRADGRR